MSDKSHIQWSICSSPPNSTAAQKNVAKKQQFRGNTNYQHFLELEEKRKLRSNEGERTQKRTTSSTTTTTTSTPRTITTEATTRAPIISRRSRTKWTSTNQTVAISDTVTASSSPRRSSTREVIRRKKKAEVHLDSDNEIKGRQEEEAQAGQPMSENQRFLSPSVRKYLALGRAIPGEPDD